MVHWHSFIFTYKLKGVMVVHYKQIVRRFNALRTKKRYKEKRIRRAFLTEAFNDGELDLYKPIPFTYKTFTDKPMRSYANIHDEQEADSTHIKFPDMIVESPIYQKPVKFNWFEKFLLWIKKW